MGVQLSKGDLNGMAGSADDVSVDIRSAGKALTGEAKPDIEGFETLGALSEVATRWRDDKVSKSATKWTTHADNMRETADHVVRADAFNSWHIQDSGN